MAQTIGTKELGIMIGVNPNTIIRAVWDGRIPEPARPGHAYQWTAADVQRACREFGFDMTLEEIETEMREILGDAVDVEWTPEIDLAD